MGMGWGWGRDAECCGELGSGKPKSWEMGELGEQRASPSLQRSPPGTPTSSSIQVTPRDPHLLPRRPPPHSPSTHSVPPTAQSCAAVKAPRVPPAQLSIPPRSERPTRRRTALSPPRCPTGSAGGPRSPIAAPPEGSPYAWSTPSPAGRLWDAGGTAVGWGPHKPTGMAAGRGDGPNTPTECTPKGTASQRSTATTKRAVTHAATAGLTFSRAQ